MIICCRFNVSFWQYPTWKWIIHFLFWMILWKAWPWRPSLTEPVGLSKLLNFRSSCQFAIFILIWSSWDHEQPGQGFDGHWHCWRHSFENPKKEDSTAACSAACGCSIVNSFLSFSVSANKIPHFVEFYLFDGTLQFRFRIRSELLVGTWLCSLTNVKHVVRWTLFDNLGYLRLSDSPVSLFMGFPH